MPWAPSARRAVNAWLEADNSDAGAQPGPGAATVRRGWSPLKGVDGLRYRLGPPTTFGLGQAP
ncbi:hypothetical protein ACSNOJ_01710 [Streptomyces sp. URMC 128]|uniref:hypothetical protein n=1 Tax=Streptomyces sp. URMC 128 TaxID=3423404 RepID=UPI003F1D5454